MTNLQDLIEVLKGGSGSGNFGHSGRPGKRGGSGAGSSAFNPNKASRSELESRGYIAVYRGTGAAGLQNIRPSSEGVIGSGVYLYDDIKQAKSYAEPGGGIVTGFVHPDDAEIRDVPGGAFSSPHKLIKISDSSKLIRRGDVPTSETSVGFSREERNRFDNLVNEALNKTS